LSTRAPERRSRPPRRARLALAWLLALLGLLVLAVLAGTAGNASAAPTGFDAPSVPASCDEGAGTSRLPSAGHDAAAPCASESEGHAGSQPRPPRPAFRDAALAAARHGRADRSRPRYRGQAPPSA